MLTCLRAAQLGGFIMTGPSGDGHQQTTTGCKVGKMMDGDPYCIPYNARIFNYHITLDMEILTFAETVF